MQIPLFPLCWLQHWQRCLPNSCRMAPVYWTYQLFDQKILLSLPLGCFLCSCFTSHHSYICLTSRSLSKCPGVPTYFRAVRRNDHHPPRLSSPFHGSKRKLLLQHYLLLSHTETGLWKIYTSLLMLTSRKGQFLLSEG